MDPAAGAEPVQGLLPGLMARLGDNWPSLRRGSVPPVKHRRTHYSSYLKDSATLVRNAVILPSSTFTSIFVTSAMRRSRKDFAAVSTARLAASSQDTVLTPTTSTIL